MAISPTRRLNPAGIIPAVVLSCLLPLPGAEVDLAKGRLLPILDARVGINTRLGDDPSLLPANQKGQAEPHLVRHCLDPELLLATFQEGRLSDGGALANGYAISTDGGLTWRRSLTPQLTTLTGGRFSRATDPVAGAGPNGELYLQALGSTQGVFDHAAVVVSRSLDRGVTWSAPLTVFESSAAAPSPDKNWLAVQDYPDAPNAGRLVSTWTAFGSADGRTQTAHLLASVSDDRGTTWTPPVNITAFGTFHPGTQPLFLPDGSLLVIYTTFPNSTGVTTIDFRCKRSLDGGRSFPAAATTIVSPVVTWNDPQLREGEYMPSAALARQTGEIFVTYIGMSGNTPRVFVTRSATQGATWTPPVIVSDQPEGFSVINPTIAAAPDGRTVAVFFMDKRFAPDGRDFVDYSVATSFDGGRTWGRNTRLSELSSELRYGPATSRGTMLGDYFGLVPPANASQPFVAIWCDTRSGNSDPFTTRFAARPTASFEAWSIARFEPGAATESALAESDHDGDGYSNLAEYHLGTNPHRAEPGQSLVVRRRQAGMAEVLWLERHDSPDRPLTVQTRHLVKGRISSGEELLASELPTESPAGLAWRGIRLSEPGDEPVEPRLGRLISADAAAVTTFAGEGPAAITNSDAQLINLSVRSQASSDPAQLIVGFAVAGRKNLLVRAAGPALANFGVDAPLADPQLTVTAAEGSAARLNDNWASGGATPALFATLGAFPFNSGSADAGLTLQLASQSATAAVSNRQNSSGITLVEVYDADPVAGAAGNSRLVNLSARAATGEGGNTLVAGFVLAGTQSRRILLRAVGPGLRSQGLPTALADPVLTLWKGNTILASNDDWSIGRSPAAIAAAAETVAAFPLAPNSLDSALLLTLAPGAYAVAVAGAEAETGVALVEIYDVN